MNGKIKKELWTTEEIISTITSFRDGCQGGGMVEVQNRVLTRLIQHFENAGKIEEDRDPPPWNRGKELCPNCNGWGCNVCYYKGTLKGYEDEKKVEGVEKRNKIMEIDMKDYYKVVSCIDKKYYSCWVKNKSYRIEYKLNEWVKVESEYCIENNYHLLVFDNFKDALYFKNFLNSEDLTFIFKCKIRGIIENIPLKKSCMQGFIDVSTNSYGDWHGGTKMFKEVKIYGKPLED